MLMSWHLAAFCLLLFQAAPSPAKQGIAGTWREPGGAVIVITSCGADLCARLAKLTAGAPPRDTNDPDPALRSRPLCGLVIGTGFHLSDPEHASGGKLYDPKSGKTYSGAMTLEGESLHLRGYVGFKVFGRTETWQRTASITACSQ